MATILWTGAVSGDWDTAANWSGGAVPIAADNVWFIDNGVSVDDGLDQSAVALASLTIDATYTGTIGTSNEYLKVHATTIDIGEAQGTGLRTGTASIKINADTTASTITVHSTQTVQPGIVPPVLLKANQATTIVHVLSGTVGIAWEKPSDTTVIDDLYVGKSGSATGPTVYLGNGVTVDQIHVYSGTCTCYGDPDDLYVWGGTLVVDTTAAIASASVYNGTLYADRCGTLSDMILYGGLADFSRTNQARTLTTCTLYPGATIIAPPSVTFTNKYAFLLKQSVTLTPAY